MKIRLIRILVAVALLAGAAYAFRGQLIGLLFSLRTESPPAEFAGLSLAQAGGEIVEVVAEGLEVPWEIRFLPSGDMLVSERPGRLVRIADDRRTVFDVPDVRQVGEGGLMGLALHPQFGDNGLIYVCFTSQSQAGLENRIERYRLGSDGLGQRRVILDGIPGASYHDGCRLEFGPDGLLYATTGDAGEPDRAQDRTSLAGKILRLTPEGQLPADNPFGTPVYSYGHRNPQGLTWDDDGRLWATEHGRSGLQSGLDELNRIDPGRNYGWPLIQGGQTRSDMVPPVLHSGPSYTWAPAGAAYSAGSVFFGGLRGEALYEAEIVRPGSPQLRVHFHGDFGRIRAVRLGPDGMLYFGTSNRDGRGRPRRSDDRILRVDPGRLR